MKQCLVLLSTSSFECEGIFFAQFFLSGPELLFRGAGPSSWGNLDRGLGTAGDPGLTRPAWSQPLLGFLVKPQHGIISSLPPEETPRTPAHSPHHPQGWGTRSLWAGGCAMARGVGLPILGTHR